MLALPFTSILCPTVCIVRRQFGNQLAHGLDIVQFAFITGCSQNSLSVVHFNRELCQFLVIMCINWRPVEQFPCQSEQQLSGFQNVFPGQRERQQACIQTEVKPSRHQNCFSFEPCLEMGQDLDVPVNLTGFPNLGDEKRILGSFCCTLELIEIRLKMLIRCACFLIRNIHTENTYEPCFIRRPVRMRRPPIPPNHLFRAEKKSSTEWRARSKTEVGGRSSGLFFQTS